MNDSKTIYFPVEDSLHLSITNDSEASSIEISPDITAELNENGEIIGIEILRASQFIKKTLLESVQAKVLNLVKAV